jgi:hypothetical protein
MPQIVCIVLVALIAYGVFTRGRSPGPSIRGEVAIPRDGTDPRLWQDGKGAEDRIRVRDRDGKFDPLFFDVDERGVLHQTPEQARDGAVVVDYRHQLYGARAWCDIGAFAGVVGTKSGDHPTQVGLRFSPARFLDGAVAADAVATEHAIGAGVSVYLPRELGAAPPWNHIGVGLWYMAAYNGGGAGAALGLTITTR